MHYVYLLALLFGVSNAAQPSPVYRAAPTILNSAPANKPAERSSGLPVTVADGTPAPQTAQERESQAFPPTSQEKISNGATANIQTPSIQSGSKATGSQPGEQLYSVFYYPNAPQTFGLQQPGSPGVQQPQTAATYPATAYQTREPVGTGAAGANGGGGGYLSSVSWTDVFVGGASLLLVGAGAAMFYPGLVGLKARAMRELSELKGEDAERMARSVMKAIRRFSELNNRE